MSFSIHIDPQGFKEAQASLAHVKNGFPRAASRAINRGLVAGRKLATKLIRARYAIKAGEAKARGFEIQKAKPSQLGGALRVKGTMLPISLFAPGLAKPPKKGQRKVVQVMIVKGRRKVLEGAFTPDGRRIFERRQPARYPIFPVFTIGVPQMLGSLKIAKEVEARIAESIATNLVSEVRFLQGNAAKR